MEGDALCNDTWCRALLHGAGRLLGQADKKPKKNLSTEQGWGVRSMFRFKIQINIASILMREVET